MTTVESSISEEKILYDLTVPCEWPEVVTALPTQEGVSLWRTLAAVTRAFAHFAVDKIQYPLRLLSGHRGVPAALSAILEARLPWKIAITEDGTLLAVLKEDHLEIRSIVDEFESVMTTCQVPVDPLPCHRRLAWDNEGTTLAVGLSSGAVLVFRSNGRLLSQLIDRVAPGDVGKLLPLSDLTFVPSPSTSENENVVSLLCVLYHGKNLETYEIREEGGPVFLHSFSFSDYFPSGVDSLLYHHSLKILIVGATPSEDVHSVVVSGWRLIDGAPYWAPKLGQEGLLNKKPKSVLSGMKLFGKSNSLKGNGVVCSMSVSPGGHLLATLEVSGRLSIWDLPALKLKKTWSQEEQPYLTQAGSSLHKGGVLPIEVSWWSDDALILVDTAGHVTVPSVRSLRNLLGDHPEPGLAITHACNGQFFVLDCESSKTAVGSRFRVPSLSEEFEQEDDSPNSLTELSFAGASSRLLKQVMFFLTESDRFCPPKKKPKVIKSRYSLACLKSMPPEECYERKMMNEEYGEALMLAQQYGLNCDLVYLRQWRAYPVSIATIQDYLSKITQRSEVLQECMNRVPDDYETTKQLLQYGLSRTSFKQLKLAGGDDDTEPLDFNDCDEVTLREMKEVISGWEKLNHEQISICQYRHLLRMYLDRLATYEVSLGGPRAADEKFSSSVYEEFRSANLVHSAINNARDGDWEAVEAIFTYHGTVVLPHRLAILSNLPETLSPQSYEDLLPSVSDDGSVYEWEVEVHREEDWVESGAISRLCALPNDAHTNTGEFIYQENPEWSQYQSPVSGEVLTNWYRERATEIEEFSGQVDYALQLIELGMEKGVKHLDLLHHHLQTLYTLVYKCNADSRLTLTRLQAMSNLEVLNLMLNEPSGPEFVKIFTECVNPFLSRLSSLQSGVGEQLLTDFLVQLAKNDLEPCLLLFQQSPVQGAQEGVFKSVKQTVTLALRVVYACERGDQLSMADGIVECLPITRPTLGVADDLSDLGAQVDLLREHLIALDTLQEYGVHKPVHCIKDIQNDPAEVQQLMIKLTRVANRRHPPLSEFEWKKLLQNLLSLRSQVFTCVDISTCYKVFAESLLCSGQEANICLASQLLTLSGGSHRRPPPTQRLPVSSFNYRLSYEVSCELVLNAAKEYFNSAASLMDEDMDLARCCLDLFSSPTAAVQTEWNLIASMGLLDDFGVNILPLQVRLTENKLDIVRNVLDSSPSAYRDYEKITRLSRLLEGAGENGSAEEESLMERKLIPSEGHSLILIILAALQKHDMKLAENLCQRLVEMKFAPAWEICRKVATDSDSLGLATKMTFMNFCLTFCPPEEIECTIALRQNLQVQSLFNGCVEKTSVISTRGRGKLSGLADTGGATTVVKGLMDKGMQGIVKSAGAMQQLIKTRQSPDSPNKPVAAKSSEGFISIVAELSKMAESATSSPRQGITIKSHSFYSTRVSTSSATDGDGGAGAKPLYYGEWGMPGDVGVKLAVNQALLYAVQVANTMAGKDDKKMDCTKALLDLAEECSCVDTPLMLGYLFALPEADSADKLLSSFPKSKCSFELALFYLCLQIYVQFRPEEFLFQQNPYTHSPPEVMNHVMYQVMSCDTTIWPETLKPLLELLHKYQEKVNDLKEADELLGLGLGIDTDQFESDSEYRHNIVLMLARTLSKKGFTIACKLAERHHIPDWEVYMELLETLLTTSSLEPHEVPRRIKDNNVMDVLLCNPQQTCGRLNDGTHEKLRGTNLTAMLSYYTALQQCLDKGATIETNIPVATHVRLLKKMKANVSGINYKVLMSGEVNPLTILSSALNDNNVHVVAKFADKIPIKGGGYMNADMVFRAYTEILFWKGDKRKQETDSDSSPKWVHRFEACQEFLVKLGVAEIRQFVKNIIFSDQSLKIGLSTRLELVKRSQRICQTRLKQDPMDTGFQEFKAELEIGCKHLKILTSSEFENITTTFSIDEEKWEEYFTELDFSMSDPSKVHLLSLKMLTDSFPIELVQTVLSLTHSVSSNKLSVAGLIPEALEECVQELSHDEPFRDSTSASTAHIIEKLEKIMTSVSNHESKSGNLVSSNQLLEVLQPFCSNSSFRAHTRRTVLQLIEKYLYLSDEDVGLLLLYQTQSILSTDFNTEVTIENLSTAESRDNFFSQLLKEATSVEKVTKLFSLLEAWANSSSVPTQSWVDLLLTAAEMSAAVGIVPVIRAGLTNIPSQVDERLVELIYKSSSSEALKLILVSSNRDNIQSTIRSLADISFPEDLNLLELIVITSSVAVIKTFHNSLYLQLCEYLQKSMTVENLNMHLFARYFQCSESELPKKLSLDCPSIRVKKVAQQLYEEGLVVDAGSLLLKLQDFHPTVSTLNGAVTFIRKLFSN